MGHREKCLVRTPLADRSSTSAALCCCHCYSKSLCLDHCGQRERKVRATQAQTANRPSTASLRRCLWRPGPGCPGGRPGLRAGGGAASKPKTKQDAAPHNPVLVQLTLKRKNHNDDMERVRRQPGGERQSHRRSGRRQEIQELGSKKREEHHWMTAESTLGSSAPLRTQRLPKSLAPPPARRLRDTRANEAEQAEKRKQVNQCCQWSERQRRCTHTGSPS